MPSCIWNGTESGIFTQGIWGTDTLCKMKKEERYRIACDVYLILFFCPSDAEFRSQSASARELARLVVETQILRSQSMMTYSNPSLRNVILDNALVLGSYDLILTNALKLACKDDKST